MPLTGVAGQLSVTADSAGRVGIVQFQRGDGYVPTAVRERVEAEWKQEVAGLRASWDSVLSATTSVEQHERMRTEKWLSADSAWSAAIVYRGATDTAVAVTVTDERVLRELRSASPYADLVLGSALLLPSSVGSIAAVYTALLTSRSSATASVIRAPPRVEAAECELELGDIVLPAAPDDHAGDAHNTIGVEAAGTLALAIPLVYPQWRIVFGRHAYLISPAGTTEQVHVLSDRDYESFGANSGDIIYAFAIQRIRRADSARRRLMEFRTAELCSSRTDVLFVRRTQAGGIAESVLVPLDEEALVTSVHRIDFVAGADSRASLGVEYTALYGGDTWIGELEWISTIPTDPPRVRSRALRRFGKTLRDASESTTGMIVDTRISGDTLSFHTLEGSDSRFMTQYVAVPLDSGRVLRATDLFRRVR